MLLGDGTLNKESRSIGKEIKLEPPTMGMGRKKILEWASMSKVMEEGNIFSAGHEQCLARTSGSLKNECQRGLEGWLEVNRRELEWQVEEVEFAGWR